VHRARSLALIALLCAACGSAGPSAPTATPLASPSTPQATAGRTAGPSPSTPAPTRSASPTPTEQPTAAPSASPSASVSPPAGAVALELAAEGLNPLVLLTHAGDGSGRVYAVEQPGKVRVGDAGFTFADEPFLDLTDRVGYGGERGLLGLAFHPDHAENGRLFVNYTNREGHTVVSELTRDPGCDCADADSERVLLTIEQPFPNHNGGMLAFGPDGYLYISSGDGGGAGDPLGAGQDLTTLLGKILRIDVDGAEPYAIPPDNPFADGADGALPEIWAFGLRNPWRMSFDRETGDLFIGDVGQGAWEEINAEPPDSGGRNYGWNVMEGDGCYAAGRCDRTGLTLPVAQYRTSEGCAVTGGYVYRGSAVPALVGTYLFADFCSGTLMGIDAASAAAGRVQQPSVLAESSLNVTGFGEDEAGEVYLVTADGAILRVAAP
jgi:glucose/arabinose dehydrogenase